MPARELCTDNAAMIASAARFARAAAPIRDYLGLDAYATGERPRDGDRDRRPLVTRRTPSPAATSARRRCACCAGCRRSSASSSRERDITSDEALQRAYFERIPVVMLDGEELFEYFVDEELLRERLESRR